MTPYRDRLQKGYYDPAKQAAKAARAEEAAAKKAEAAKAKS